ncbi:MAG: helix-turn-helix transcriptional regulator [Chlorobi bacterium]|nr:helix-turn-helix transcriptional regulator [Chlorobiota bacterium]
MITPEAIFGEIVRQRRCELGLTQVDLQLGSLDEAEISQPHISNLEHGLKQPCLRTMLHLERVLELPPGKLFRRVRLAVERLSISDELPPKSL